MIPRRALDASVTHTIIGLNDVRSIKAIAVVDRVMDGTDRCNRVGIEPRAVPWVTRQRSSKPQRKPVLTFIGAR